MRIWIISSWKKENEFGRMRVSDEEEEEEEVEEDGREWIRMIDA